MNGENPRYIHEVNVYYEDTDFSGAVYHANYLKYCERAREHILGPSRLRALFDSKGLGFVVYRAELSFKNASRFADTLEVVTAPTVVSPVRISFKQDIYRVDPGPRTLVVAAIVDLVLVDKEGKPVRLPEEITALDADRNHVPS